MPSPDDQRKASSAHHVASPSRRHQFLTADPTVLHERLQDALRRPDPLATNGRALREAHDEGGGLSVNIRVHYGGRQVTRAHLMTDARLNGRRRLPQRLPRLGLSRTNHRRESGTAPPIGRQAARIQRGFDIEPRWWRCKTNERSMASPIRLLGMTHHPCPHGIVVHIGDKSRTTIAYNRRHAKATRKDRSQAFLSPVQPCSEAGMRGVKQLRRMRGASDRHPVDVRAHQRIRQEPPVGALGRAAHTAQVLATLH